MARMPRPRHRAAYALTYAVLFAPSCRRVTAGDAAADATSPRPPAPLSPRERPADAGVPAAPLLASAPAVALSALPTVDQEALRVTAAAGRFGVVWWGQRLDGWPRLRPGERVIRRVAYWPTPPAEAWAYFGPASAMFVDARGQLLGLRALGASVSPVGVQVRVVGEDDFRHDCVAGPSPRDRAPCPEYFHDHALASSGGSVVLARVAQRRAHPADRPLGPFCVSTLPLPLASPRRVGRDVGCVPSSEDPMRWPHHLLVGLGASGGLVAWRSGDAAYTHRLDAAGELIGETAAVPHRGGVTGLALAFAEGRADLGWCERDPDAGAMRRAVMGSDGAVRREGTCATLAMGAAAGRRWTAWVEGGDAGDALWVRRESDGAAPATLEVLREPALGEVALAADEGGAVLAWSERGARVVRWTRLRDGAPR